MVKIKAIIFWLCVSLSMTSIAFFKIGLAEFTLFHALVIFTTFCLGVLAVKNRDMVVKYPVGFFAVFAYICIVNLCYLDTIKLTSFVYTVVILLELLLLYNVVKRLSVEDIRKICKVIILLYTVNIAVATLMIATKQYPSGIWADIFQIYNFDGRIRPYGFSDEPSYAAITLVFTLFILFKCEGFRYRKDDFVWYACAVISIVLSRSSYGYMLLAMLLLYFLITSRMLQMQLESIIFNKVLNARQLGLTLVLMVMAAVLVIGSLDFRESKSVNRLVTLVSSFTEPSEGGFGDRVTNTKYVDGSASMRLVPSVHLAENFKESEWKYVLFGRGAGQATPFFSRIYEGNTTLLGFIPVFIYNYGLIGTVLCFLLFLGMFPRHRLLLFILFFLFLFNADFNTQIFLFILFSVMACKHIEKSQVQSLNPSKT